MIAESSTDLTATTIMPADDVFRIPSASKRNSEEEEEPFSSIETKFAKTFSTTDGPTKGKELLQEIGQPLSVIPLEKSNHTSSSSSSLNGINEIRPNLLSATNEHDIKEHVDDPQIEHDKNYHFHNMHDHTTQNFTTDANTEHSNHIENSTDNTILSSANDKTLGNMKLPEKSTVPHELVNAKKKGSAEATPSEYHFIDTESPTEPNANLIYGEISEYNKNKLQHSPTNSTNTESAVTTDSGVNSKHHTKIQKDQKDPYHLHILVENHDHHADQLDYQVLSSTEEISSTDKSYPSSRYTVQTSNYLNAETANFAPVVDPIVQYFGNTVTTSATPTLFNKALTHNEMTIQPEIIRGRSMNLTSTVVVNATSKPLLEAHSMVNQDMIFTDEQNQDQVPFTLDGKSIGSSSKPREAIGTFQNFVTTERMTSAFATKKEPKNINFMDLSDVSMDGDSLEAERQIDHVDRNKHKLKITEVTAVGDSMSRVCMDNGKSYTVRFLLQLVIK